MLVEQYQKNGSQEVGCKKESRGEEMRDRKRERKEKGKKVEVGRTDCICIVIAANLLLWLSSVNS